MTEDQLTNHHTTDLSETTDAEPSNVLPSAIDLAENTARGLVCEVLVALAFDGEVTKERSPWDVTLNNGTRVEVKTSGAIQACRHAKAYKPSWDIARHSAQILTRTAVSSMRP